MQRQHQRFGRVTKELARVSALLCLLALCGALVGGAAAAQPLPASLATEINIVPDEATIVGCHITVDIRIGHVGYLAGYGYKLRFDPTVLEVVDSDAQTSGVQIAGGDVFGSKPNAEAQNNANNVSGEVEFAGMLIGARDSVTIPAPNTASLGKITFRVVGPGTSALQFDPSAITRLSDRDGMPIEAQWHDGELTATRSCEHLYIPLVANGWR